MRHFRHFRNIFSFRAGVCVAALALAWPAPARAQPFTDPVEDLKEALLSPPSDDPFQPDPRQAKIEELTRSLKTIGDLSRALRLPEWEAGIPPSPPSVFAKPIAVPRKSDPELR